MCFTAPRSVHIILSQHERVTDQSFEIVLGGEGNQRSWISRGSNQILRADIHGSLSEDSFQPFWISWEEGIIQVGTGSIPNVADTKFMFTRQSDEQTRGIRFIGFATSDGATGEFRLWQKEGRKHIQKNVGNIMYLKTFAGRKYAKIADMYLNRCMFSITTEKLEHSF